MSVVKMNKVTIIGLESEKENLLSQLMELGVVELRDQSEKLLTSEWAAVTRKDGNEDAVAEWEGRLNRVQTAMDAMERYDKAKKPLFKSRRAITEQEYESVLAKQDEIDQEIDRVVGLYDSWNEKKTEENSLVSAQASLMPWTSYDLPLELTETRCVKVICGVVPAVTDIQEIREQLTGVSEETELSVLGHDEEQQYLNVLCMKADEDAVWGVLKGHGFTTAQFKDMTGTVSQNLERLNRELEACRNAQKELEEQLSKAAEGKDEIRCYYDSLTIGRDQAKASESLLRTNQAFCLDGWMIADKQKEVEAIVEANGAICEVTEPEPKEETPILLKNSTLITPFESITGMYALPKSYEVDPTPIFALFYFIFYGMMFADVGYGALLFGGCVFFIKKYHLEGTSYKLLKTLSYCGISTMIWGVLFGGFFGDAIGVIASTFFGLNISFEPLWVDPLESLMMLLVFSCVLGTIHLFVGMGIKAYMYIKDGKIMDAISEVFAWYIFIIGLAMLLFGGSLFAGASNIGKYLAIIGAIIIVGAPLVRNKGVTKLLGLWDLYGVTSYLADILSYSRLLALGLASTVIAQVFNQLGSLFGSGIVLVIVFIVIFVIGHTLNFAINALGSFVHASRLQYVEFFGKFYEGGGDEFQPFAKKTKYVKIVKEDN